MSTDRVSSPSPYPGKRVATEPASLTDYDADMADFKGSVGETIEPRDKLLLSMAGMLRENNQKLTMVSYLTKKVGELQREVKRLNETVIKLEFEMAASSVLLRKMPRHPDSVNNQNESFIQTEKMVSDFLEAAKIKDQIRVVSAIRFKPSKDPKLNKKGGTTPIKVTFSDKRQVLSLFTSLSNLQTTIFKNVSVQKEVPSSLRTKNEFLEKKSYELRKNNDAKCRIDQKGADLALFYKLPNDKNWREWKDDKAEKVLEVPQ